MGNFLIVDPVRKFEIQGQVRVLQTAQFNFAAGANQEVISAGSGVRRRVMGWSLQSANAANGSIYFKSASGGTRLTATFWPPAIAPTAVPWDVPVVDSGYFETITGEGLYCDVATQPVSGNIYFITYTPT